MRSIWKGPAIPFSFLRLLSKMISRLAIKRKRVSVSKTYYRKIPIIPELVGFTLLVHNGIKFMPVNVTTEHCGYKVGEFSRTRKVHSLKSVAEKKKKKLALKLKRLKKVKKQKNG